MIYFDNAATTKVSEVVLNTYLDAVKNDFANPSSIHFLGMQLTNKINHSRDNILKYLHLNSEYEVIFTSSATEANNLSIIGYCLANKNRGNVIVTTHIEHASVLETFKYLEKEHGFVVRYLDIDESGKFNVEQVNQTIDNKTILVALTPINNEVGLYVDVELIKSKVSQFPKCVLHLDCSQTLGKYKFDYNQGDLITISSHKIHGLKSISCLIKKKKIRLNPILVGGGQENNLRSSTLDAPLIFSFEIATKEIMSHFIENYAKVTLIFNFLVENLRKIPGVKLHLFKMQTPYILNFSIDKKASVVVEALSNKEIYVSSTSACSSKKEVPSYVIYNLTKSENESKNSIRLSFSSENIIEECKVFLNELNNIFNTLRS